MSTQVPREKVVFLEAVEITDLEQRRQFLNQACGADQVLREQVEKLLALSPSAGEFFNECAPALAAVAGDADRVVAAAESAFGTEPLEASRIGPYKLLQKLGEGGYGVVYMAEQEKPIRRRVALKIIKLGMDTRNVVARFEAERQALALMDHPNIARVLDAGATETGRPYFVMELVYGVKITDYCDQNRVTMQERLELFIQVCNAVQHAHQKGIIHRDLKPSNIMVTMHDGVPVPKVIDFGIAKATEQRLTDKTLFTSYAQLMGTPAYMSPEQMELSGLNLDTRSDIYSLGVLLYELLTGGTPFDTAELLKLGMEELRRTICEREPLSPSAKLKTLTNEELTRTARRRHVEAPRLVSQLCGDLDWIVLKCLEKDRTRRYATANALAMDVERHLHEEAVLARPPSQLYRLQKLVRRNRMVFLSGTAAVMALLLATIFSTLMFLKEREAKISEARLRQEAELREAASHVLRLVTQRRFEEADRLAAGLPLDKPSIEIAAELRALGDWHALNGRWPEAAARFQSLLKVNQLEDVNLIAADHLRLAAAFLRSGNRDGFEQFRQAQVARLGVANIASEYWTFKIGLLLPPDANLLQGFALAGEAVERKFPSREDMGPNPAHGVQWTETLALLDYRRGRFSQAIEWGYRYEKWGILTGARVTKTCLIKAMSNWQLGQYRTALVDWSEAYELIQAKLEQGLDLGIGRSAVFPGIGAPEELESPWWDWVNAGLLMRECDAVFAQSEHLLDSRPESDVVSGDSVTALARALGEWHAIRGEWEKARKRFEPLRLAASDNRGPVDHLSCGMAALKLGDETGYLRLRDEALHRFKDLADEDAAVAVMKLSLLRPLGETTAGALEPFVQVLERTVASAGPIKKGTTTSVAWDLMLLGLVEYRRGDYARAMEWCQRSLDTSTFMPLPTVMDRVILAMSLHQLGDAAAARSELGRALSPVRGGMNRDFDRWHWQEWVYARLLLQEAEGLIP